MASRNFEDVLKTANFLSTLSIEKLGTLLLTDGLAVLIALLGLTPTKLQYADVFAQLSVWQDCVCNLVLILSNGMVNIEAKVAKKNEKICFLT